MKKYFFFSVIVFVFQTIVSISLNHDLLILSPKINRVQSELDQIKQKNLDLISEIAEKESISQLSGNQNFNDFIEIVDIVNVTIDNQTIAQK